MYTPRFNDYMDYEVTYSVSGYITVHLRARDVDEALEEAEDIVRGADLNRMSKVDFMASSVDCEDGGSWLV